MSQSIDIVIVNWNAGRLLDECLASIEQAVPTVSPTLSLSVFVVDNGSTDKSLSRHSGELPIKTIVNANNEGFGRACNQGAAAGHGDLILFLNPDARLTAGALEEACAFLSGAEGRPFGVCGVQLIDDNGAVSRSCARFPGLVTLLNDASGLSRLAPRWFLGLHMAEWPHDRSCAVDHVIGAFYLVRRSVFEAVSGFDEDFFVYLEDLDLSYRIKAAGLGCYYLATARCYHAGGGVSRQILDRRLFYALRSRLVYVRKHMGWPQRITILLVTLLVEPLARSALLLSRGNWAGLASTVRGYRLLWRWLIFFRDKPRALLD